MGQFNQFVQFTLATDKRAQVSRQITAGGFSLASDRRKRPGQIRRAKLVDTYSFYTLEVVFTEIQKFAR